MKLRLGLLYLGAASIAFMCGAVIVQAQDASGPGAKPATAMPSVLTVLPPEAQPSPHFSAEAATNAYLAQIPADATSRSDVYFRRRRLVDSLGLPGWSGRMHSCLATAVVGSYAEFRRENHALQAVADFYLLDQVPHSHVDLGFPSRGLGRLLSRTQIRVSDANIRSADE
jgi:hypothetical protein